MTRSNEYGAKVQDLSLPRPRLLLDVVSRNARADPTKTWASVPCSQNDPAAGYLDLTYSQLHNAVNRSATWMSDTFNREAMPPFEPLAGPPDTRYVIFTLAAIKAGFQVRAAVILLLRHPYNTSNFHFTDAIPISSK